MCVLGESPGKNTYFSGKKHIFLDQDKDLPAKGTLKRGVGVKVTKRNIYFGVAALESLSQPDERGIEELVPGLLQS